MDNPEELQAYASKLLELQRQPQALSEAELEQIAYTLGLSPSEWAKTRQQLKEYLKQAEILLPTQAQTALEQAQQALNLHPQHPQGLKLAALASARLFERQGSETLAQQALQYSQQALIGLAPQERKELLILPETLQKARQKHQSQKRKKWYVLGSILGTLALIFGLILLQTRSQLQELWLNLEKERAHLDGTYQRRLDLLPKIQAILNQSPLKTELEKLQNLSQEKISLDKPQDYLQQQTAIAQSLAKIQAELSQGQNNNTLYQDVLVQIEGAENRINVQRRRYNEAISLYNRQAQGSLAKWLGYAPEKLFEQGALGKDLKLE